MEDNTTFQTRGILLNEVDKLKSDAVQVVQDVRDHAHAQVDDVRQRVIETVHSVRESLTSHPFALLGAGFVVGFFFGSRLVGSLVTSLLGHRREHN